MKCAECKKNEANVHLTVVQGNQQKEFYLCHECRKLPKYTQLMQLEEPFWHTGIFDHNDFFKNFISSATDYRLKAEQCSQCGISLAEIKNNYQFGCPHCYQFFRGQVEEMLARAQGANRHIGKVPLQGKGVFTVSRQIRRLKQQLKAAVTAEQYEEAARLRDEIHSLENSNTHNEAERMDS